MSLGGPGNWFLGLPHLPSELRGVGVSPFSVLVTNVPLWVPLVVVDCVGGSCHFRVRCWVNFRVSGNWVYYQFLWFRYSLRVIVSLVLSYINPY